MMMLDPLNYNPITDDYRFYQARGVENVGSLRTLHNLCRSDEVSQLTKINNPFQHNNPCIATTTDGTKKRKQRTLKNIKTTPTKIIRKQRRPRSRKTTTTPTTTTTTTPTTTTTMTKGSDKLRTLPQNDGVVVKPYKSQERVYNEDTNDLLKSYLFTKPDIDNWRELSGWYGF